MNHKNQTRPDMTGVLFVNEGKEGNQPDYTGRVKIQGKEWRIAAWDSESRNGQTYLSLKFSGFERYDNLPTEAEVEKGIPF